MRQGRFNREPLVRLGSERFVLYDNSGRELCRSRDVQELRRVMRATGAGCIGLWHLRVTGNMTIL